MTGAKKMYTNTGQEVRSFSQLRNEFAEVDTFYLSNTAAVPIIPIGPGLVASPIRRSRSRASLTGVDPNVDSKPQSMVARQQRARSKSRPRILYAPESEVVRSTMGGTSNAPPEYPIDNLKEDPTRVVIRGLRRTFYPPNHHAPVDNSPPDKKLLLTWVHGYRGIDSRRNLWVLPSGELLYFVAAVAVLYDREEENQRHYTGHTEDIMW
jgi:echinoderm microtubule-associated protein-like 1/2